MRVGRPLAAVAVTALALAGCSSGGGTTPAQSGESTESSGSGGTQEIILLAYQSETVMQTVVDAFNESQSDVHVTVQTSEPTDGGSYAQALQTRVAGNQAPDIFNIVAENRTDVLQHDLAMDLTGMPVVDTVPGSYLDLYRKDGGVYGVTFTAWMGGLVYNKDLLSQAGFDTVPDQWEEFATMGPAFDGVAIPFLEDQAFSSGSLTSLIASSMNAAGIDSAEWVYDGKTADMTYAEAWTGPLTQWNSAIEAGTLSKESVGLGSDQIKSAFLSGEVAMFRSGNWDAADIEDAGINYGFAAFPAYPGGETYINGGGDPAYAISSASSPEKQEAAKTFLEWLGSADGVKLLSEGQGAMSISDNFTSEAAPEFKDAYENNLKKGLFYWIEWSAGAPAMTATMSAQQQMMIQGQATPESFAEAMDAQAASIK